MTIATINRFIQSFGNCFEALSVDVSMPEVEQLAMVVHRCVNGPQRVYHNASHVLGLADGSNPRQALAALFHDAIYCQLDGGIAAHVRHWLDGIVESDGLGLRLRRSAPDHPAVAMCMRVFAFTPGQVLPPLAGMNEFLSAALACRMLGPHLGDEDLLAIVACIEATIPFRRPDAQGQSAMQALQRRLSLELQGAGDASAPARAPDAAQARAAAMVRDAVELANRDVGGFSEPQPAVFLSGTWQLIEESNAPLTAVGVYSIQEYRQALMRMDGFLEHLDPASVHQCFGDLPDPSTLAGLREAARRNIAFAVTYLRAKVATVAIVEACALCTGGDCPVSMLLGDIRNADGRPDRAEDLLPAAGPALPVSDDPLLMVLERGRAMTSRNDLTESPLTAFVYRSIGIEGIEALMRSARRMFAGEITPRDFLAGTHAPTARAIVEACAQIALSRASALRALAQGL